MEKEIMRTTNLTPKTSARPRLIWMVALAVSALLTLGYARLSFGQRSEPKTFSSPGEASNALFQAVKNEDEQALEAILGAGKEVTSSSDEDEERFEVDCVSRGVSVIRGQDLRSHPEGDRLRERPRARNTDSRPTDESPHRSELAYDGVRDDGAETDGSPAISFLDRGSRTEFLLRLSGADNYFCSHGSLVSVRENCIRPNFRAHALLRRCRDYSQKNSDVTSHSAHRSGVNSGLDRRIQPIPWPPGLGYGAEDIRHGHPGSDDAETHVSSGSD